jgi:acetyltransferase-like isoleucine patch superfamily enzyme
MNKRIDLDTVDSQHSGFKGFFERLLRRFKIFIHIGMMAPLYLFSSLIFGLCLVPGISLFRYLSEVSAESNLFVQSFAYGFSIAAGYFLFGFSLLVVAPLVNFILRANLEAWRGPYYSAETFKWFIHNGLTYLVRYTFLEFVTPTPISNVFYQMMGMKIGRHVVINTTHISDPSLIEIGDKVTIGGSVTMVAHYGQGGLMVIAPIKIGAGCTIGLKASIMGGVEIGEGAKIMPHSVILPKTIIPAGETWGGVPAQRIESPAAQLKLIKSA